MKVIELWRWVLFGFLCCCVFFLCNVLVLLVEYVLSCCCNVELVMECLLLIVDLWLGFYFSLVMEWNICIWVIGMLWGRSFFCLIIWCFILLCFMWSLLRWGVVVLCCLFIMNLRRFFERLVFLIYFFFFEEFCYGRVEVC